MASRKAPLLLILLLSLSALSASVVFNVSVDQQLRYDVSDFQMEDNVTNIQNMNLSVKNTGSVGCDFRLRTAVNSSRDSVVKYSKSKPLWPGEEARLKVYFLPESLGERKANLSLRTCKGWKKIREVGFNVRNLTNSDAKINYTKLDASKGKIKIKTSLEEALLVPEKVPPYWQVPHASVENKTASLMYDPEIYRPEENMTYKVYNQSSRQVLGEFKVSVREEKTLLDYLNTRSLLAGVLAALLINAALISKRLRNQT